MAEPLKNSLNKPYVTRLANSLKQADKAFDAKKFIKDVINSHWESRELKQRLTHITLTMGEHLPADYNKAIPIILKAAPDFGGWEALFFPEFVSTFGLDKKHRKISLKALEELTQYSSSELAVRPFILQDPEPMMKWMLKLSKHKNYHMRRLASEGCRPRLPWAPALPDFKNDPSLILPILENLRSDSELYVRKSVANNLNDIGKDNPKATLKVVKRWKKESPTEETQWIINHGLRSLIKLGEPQALKILGFDNGTSLKMRNFKLSHKKRKLGENLGMEVTLANSSRKTQKVMLDYVIHHCKKSGERTPKVFKWKRFDLKPGETVTLEKIHKLQKINTRKYYSGEHLLQVQINGQTETPHKFYLQVN